MKYLLTACALLAQVCCFAQDTLPQRHARENTFTCAVERGGTVDYDSDFFDLNAFTQLKQYASYGLSVGYMRSFPVAKRSALVLGISANSTLFSSQVIYRNPTFTIIFNSDTLRAVPLRSHDLGKTRSAYFALDFQALYSLRFPVRNHWTIAPYAGVKLRNVIYIMREQRNVSTGVGSQDINGTDTIFYMQADVSYRMRDSRIVIMPTFGVTVEKPLANGGRLGFFADYSYAIINRLQIDYWHFDNIEQYEVTASNGQNTTTYFQKFSINHTNDHALTLALNMSHIRIGISYTLPRRQR